MALKITQRRVVFPDMRKFYSRLSVHKGGFPGTQSAYSLTDCPRLLLSCEGRVAEIETIWPAKPKTFTVWLLPEGICQALVRYELWAPGGHQAGCEGAEVRTGPTLEGSCNSVG